MILLSAAAPAAAQFDFATQADTRFAPVLSEGWVQAGPPQGVVFVEPYSPEAQYPQASAVVSPSARTSAANQTGNPFFTSAGRQSPHPAVVRVIAAEPGGASLGSGTLVDVNDENGLVITNWHVVRDAPGSVIVVFPDGFQSMGRVLRMDSNWDLAAILIKKPQAAPVRVARDAPRVGETLSIAGYGSGAYRAAAGACTQYLAPSTSHPYELVELAASARQGDSGGPIFNAKGELAGVLFGEGGGRTTGAYCGRVHNFLTLAVQQLRQQNGTMLAAAPTSQTKQQEYFAAASANASQSNEGWRAKSAPQPGTRISGQAVAAEGASHVVLDTSSGSLTVPISSESALPASFYAAAAPPAAGPTDLPATVAAPFAAIAPGATARGLENSTGVSGGNRDQAITSSGEHFLPQSNGAPRDVARAPGEDLSAGWVAADQTSSLRWQLLAGDTIVAQFKTLLAGIGVLALLFHGTRALARTATLAEKPAARRAKKA